MAEGWSGQDNSSFIHLAQYLAGLNTHHDIWDEVGRALHSFLEAEVVAIGSRLPEGGVAIHDWFYQGSVLGGGWTAVFRAASQAPPSEQGFAAQARAAVADTLESGFLTTRHFSNPFDLAVAFLPISLQNQVKHVMIVGQARSGEFPRQLLNLYLGVAGLVGATVARVFSEREIRLNRQLLEDLVSTRTEELTEANNRLNLEIAERRRAEEALRKSESRLRTIIDQAPVMINSFDREGRCQLWNRECVKRLGWTWGELEVSQDPLAPCYPDQEARQLARESMLRADGRFRELSVTAKDGSRLAQRWADFRLPDGSRISLGYDVTKAKQAERALVESERKYRALVENAQEAIIILQGGAVTFVNPAGLAMAEVGAEEVLGRQLKDLVSESDWVAYQAVWEQWESDQEPVSPGVCQLRNKGGRLISLLVNPARIDWQGQKATMIIARDVTREREMESRLRQSQKMEAIGTLAGGIAHEFNNILAVIGGYGELALQAASAGKATPSELSQIMAASDRAKTLVRQILAFSRKVEPRLELMDINQEISRILELMKQTLPRMISLCLDLAPGLGWVRTDSSYIQQVVMNLVSNAADAMPQGGGLTIRTREARVEDLACTTCGESFAGDYVLLQVEDAGHGMDRQTASRVFDPFFTTKEVGAGTGLGLSTVYGVVREHKGHVLCDSRLGQGTTFSVYLPSCKVGPESETSPARPGKVKPGDSRLILMVDDEEQIRNLAMEMLSKAGYQVAVAGSGEEALEYVSANPGMVDLVVLDLSMPGMGGHRCLQELLVLQPSLKVLIASGYSTQGQAGDTLAHGAAGFIAKPFRLKDFLLSIQAVLRG